MKFILTANGNIKKGENGNPVVLTPDGKEQEIDAIANYKQIPVLMAEAKDHRLKKMDYKTQLEAIPEAIRTNPTAASDALATVGSLSDKHKLDIEGIKSGLQKSYDESAKLKDTEIAKLKDNFYTEKVTSQFAKSSFLEGTIFNKTRDIAATYFKKHFTIDEDGSLTGTMEDGNVIYSKENPGKKAGFEDCIKTLFENHPDKDSLMSATQQRGSGRQQRQSGDGEQSVSTNDRYKSGLAARKAQQ